MSRQTVDASQGFLSSENMSLSSCVDDAHPPAIPTTLSSVLPGNDDRTIPEALIRDLRDYFGMEDDEDVRSAGRFLVALGCKELHEIQILQVEDIRAEVNCKPPALIRSKMIQACKVLRNGGDLEELRMIGKQTKGDLITIKVGEETFTTNRSTLCRVKGSFLESLLSGRHPNPARRSENGEYFIDRSGKFFPYILEYLRYGSVLMLPTTEDEKLALALEADFYGLEDLSKAIRGPKVCTAMFLSDRTLELQANEQEARSKFFSGSEDLRFSDPTEGLIPLFNERERGYLYGCPILFDRASGDDADDVELLLDSGSPPLNGEPMTVESLAAFERAFNRRRGNVLGRLKPILRQEPIVFAGGSILAGLLPSLTSQQSKDIDLFICTKDKGQAARIAERVWKALARDHERWVIVRSPGVINMHLWMDERIVETVQVVLRLYSSVTEVLYGFDCDSCCCAYDGREVFLTPRCYRALQTMTNVVNPLHAWPNRSSYELRLAKYALRGFSVAVPGLDTNRVDPKLYCKRFSELQGLARLLRIAFEIERSESGTLHGISEPHQSEGIREPALEEVDPVRLLFNGANGFYDESPSRVYVPSVFCDGDPMACHWYRPGMGGDPSDFPLSSEIRDPAWIEIVDFSAWDEVEDVPYKLVNAWSDSAKSREFLNSKMDKDEVDNLYYMGAYKEAMAPKTSRISMPGI